MMAEKTLVEMTPEEKARFEAFNAFSPGEQDVIVGIRPEYIRIDRDGAMEATVYSTLPSGMETTIRLNAGKLPLTAVVFGDQDFPVDGKVRFSFSKAAVLFDPATGTNIASGTLV